MSQTPNQSPVKKNVIPARVMDTLRMLWQILKRNWGSKLLAFLLAVALWGGLITQDPTLTREKNFRNVAVTVSGTDTLKRNGLVVTSDLTQLLNGVNLSVNVPQMQYTGAQASNYNVRLDLSRIIQPGEQDVRILTSNSSAYGSVIEVSPASVRLNVEKYITQGRIRVNVITEGEAPVGYYATEPVCDPAMITVSGPESIVTQIDRAEVTVKQDALPAREGLVERAVEFTLLDVNGQPIVSDMLQVTSESVLLTRINVAQQVYAKRDIPLLEESIYRGVPAEGYEVADVFVSPEYITVAGKKSIVDSVSMFTARKAINIAGQSETVTDTIELSVPVNLAFISASRVSVTVVIQPIQETRVFRNIPLTILNAKDASVAVNVTSANVSITGAQTWVKKLSAADLTLSCDVEGLEPGVHVLPLQCVVNGSDGQEFTVDIEPLTVRVIITAPEGAE